MESPAGSQVPPEGDGRHGGRGENHPSRRADPRKPANNRSQDPETTAPGGRLGLRPRPRHLGSPQTLSERPSTHEPVIQGEFWCQITCYVPHGLMEVVQRAILDFFWSSKHWLQSSVLLGAWATPISCFFLMKRGPYWADTFLQLCFAAMADFGDFSGEE